MIRCKAARWFRHSTDQTFRDANYGSNKSVIRVMDDREGIVRVGDHRYTRGYEHKYRVQPRDAIKGKGGFFLTTGGCETDARLIDFSR